jgi:hypothetical protein
MLQKIITQQMSSSALIPVLAVLAPEGIPSPQKSGMPTKDGVLPKIRAVIDKNRKGATVRAWLLDCWKLVGRTTSGAGSPGE